MKKLGKLQVNSNKLMEPKELTTLRGGYGDCNFTCRVREYYQGPIFLEGECCLESAEACCTELANLYHLDTTCWHN